MAVVIRKQLKLMSHKIRKCGIKCSGNTRGKRPDGRKRLTLRDSLKDIIVLKPITKLNKKVSDRIQW